MSFDMGVNIYTDNILYHLQCDHQNQHTYPLYITRNFKALGMGGNGQWEASQSIKKPLITLIAILEKCHTLLAYMAILPYFFAGIIRGSD